MDWRLPENFDTLKQKLISSPILIFPNFSKPFNLHTDASGKAIGSVLAQIQDDGKESAIAYGGRTLTAAEINYNTTELEGLE